MGLDTSSFIDEYSSFVLLPSAGFTRWNTWVSGEGIPENTYRKRGYFLIWVARAPYNKQNQDRSEGSLDPDRSDVRGNDFDPVGRAILGQKWSRVTKIGSFVESGPGRGSQLLYRMILISALAGLQIATYENVKVPIHLFQGVAAPPSLPVIPGFRTRRYATTQARPAWWVQTASEVAWV